AIMMICQLTIEDAINELPITKYGFLAVILYNAIASIISQEFSKYTISKMKLISDSSYEVLRDGKYETIKSNDILLSDIIKLKSGDQIPCDLVNLGDELAVNESMLTGESDNIIKKKGDIILSGSYVVFGVALARVEKVGNDTYVSSLENKIHSIAKKKSELTININKIIHILLLFLFPTIVAVFLKTWYVGTTVDNPLNGTNWVFTLNILSKCVTTVVGMIPIGMILLTTITLAESIIKLSRKNTMVQDLYAIENLSRIDTLCLDKTGTLTTQNYYVYKVKKFKELDLGNIITNIILANNDSNATSKALNSHFKNVKLFEIEANEPFSSKTKRSFIRLKNGEEYYLGAPEYLIKDKKHLEEINSYSKEGYRVLAITSSRDDLGYVVLKYELRKGIKDTLNYFLNLNVDIKIISGDNPLTVKSVSKEAGVKNYESYISMENVPLEDIKDICDKYTIFGRTSPDQKQEIIKQLELKGKVVGYVGDGVNDTQSLRQSDCSIALNSGAESTKAVSDVILLDDDFTNLPYVLEEGRRVVCNVKRSLSLFLAKSFFIFLISWMSLFFKTGLVIEVEALYIYEFVTIAFCGLLLSLENGKAEPVKTNFVSDVILRSFIFGLFMMFAASIPSFFNNFISLPNVESLVALNITLAGLVILFEICKPMKRYTLIVFIIGLVLNAGALISAPDLFLNMDYLKQSHSFGEQIKAIFNNFFNWDLYFSFNLTEIILASSSVLVLYPLYLGIKKLCDFLFSKRHIVKKFLKR
ncbi:MAG: HAD-IC family P-type ATPase, partial [Bacilli bacterium]|nr:HAD-IC family P-type ATPase [Bacilli bacterium]